MIQPKEANHWSNIFGFIIYIDKIVTLENMQ